MRIDIIAATLALIALFSTYGPISTASVKSGKKQSSQLIVGQFRISHFSPPNIRKRGEKIHDCIEYAVEDKFGVRHPVKLNGEVSRSFGGPESLLGRWVLLSGHKESDRSELIVMDRVDSIRPEVIQQNRDPFLSNRLPADFNRINPPNAVIGKKRSLATRTIKYLSLLVRFADTASFTPHPSAYYDALMSSTWPGLDDFMRETSYGKLRITNQTVGWITLPKAKDNYYEGPTGSRAWNADLIIKDALSSIDGQVDFKSLYAVNIFPNAESEAGGAYARMIQLNADGVSTIAATMQNLDSYQSALGHEDGHTLGNDHTSGPYNTPYDSRWDVDSTGASWQNAGGILGNVPVSVPYNAYHRARLGWIDKAHIYYAFPGTSKQIRIERLSKPSRPDDYLMAKIYIGGYATRYYTVEARRYAGYDVPGGIPGECVLIHNCDELRIVTDAYGGPRSDRASQVVDPDHNGDPNDEAAMWRPGEKFVDPTNGVTIRVDSMDSTGYLVTISVSSSAKMPGVVSNTTDSDGGSLREALRFHHEWPEKPIPFVIPPADPGYANSVYRIQLKSPLPDILESGTVLDGTVNGKPAIFLDGSNAGLSHGLVVGSSNCTLSGLIVGNFSYSGIWINSPASHTAVQNCSIGIGPVGAIPNQWDGISIWTGSHDNVIQNNVISGNTHYGITVSGPGGNNWILGNKIGTDSSGNNPMPNNTGILLSSGTSGNAIGGSGTGEGNLVSGNGSQIQIFGPAHSNLITGNTVGPNLGGTKSLSAAGWGIALRYGAAGNIIEGNLISGNLAGSGIGIGEVGSKNNVIKSNLIGLSRDGTALLPNYDGIYFFGGASNNHVGLGTTSTQNVIAGNSNSGVTIGGITSTGNFVSGNQIGCDTTGSVARPNGKGIILSDGTNGNLIGGFATGQGNTISGNQQEGIMIYGPTSNNQIVGNRIGSTASGTRPLGNKSMGIHMRYGVSNTLIYKNLVSGNGGPGVAIGESGSTNDRITGNIIGIDSSGTMAIPNQCGVFIFAGAHGNHIGSSAALDRNVISGNLTQGVLFVNVGTDGNFCQGNFIGTDSTGLRAIPNKAEGIRIGDSAKNSVVGGTASERNIVASNLASGILLDRALSTVIQGNYIGCNRIGKLLGNVGAGVLIINGAASNTIGGSSPTIGNRITGNLTGVQVEGAESLGNTIRCNSISSNLQLGINLLGNDTSGGVTLNDLGDFDTGPNDLQNFPKLTTIAYFGSAATVGFTLDSKPNRSYVVDVYGIASGDALAFGQGDRFLQSIVVNTDATGKCSKTTSLVLPIGVRTISATATETSSGNTSEFGPVLASPSLASISISKQTVSAGAAFMSTIHLTSNAPAGGLYVFVTDTTAGVSLPARIFVPTGASSASFTVQTKSTTTKGPSTLVARLAGTTLSATFTIQ